MAVSLKHPKIQDAVGIDFGITSTKLVRLRRSGSSYALIDADVQEPFSFLPDAKNSKLSIPKKMLTAYAGACITSVDANVRFLYVASKLNDDRAIANRVRKSLGLESDYRVGYTVVQKGKDGMDHKVLASGVPGGEVQAVRKLFSSNRPSLISLEVSGLASLASFSHTAAVNSDEGAVCYIEAGATTTTISFFLGGELRLVRKLDVGATHIQRRIQDVLVVGEDEALTVLFEDARPLLEASVDPIGGLLQEISISQKFVERNENTKIAKVYASGGLSYSPYWCYVMEQTLSCPVEIWDPFSTNGIKSCPRGVRGVESMFAGAVGAAISVLNQA